MSPIFAALPPADLPSMAYHPAALHAAQLVGARTGTTHTVRSGDTVYDIAAQHGVSPRALVTANRLKDGGRWIMPGQVLRIPTGGTGPSTTPTAVRPPAAPTATRPVAARPAPAPAATGGTVTVRSGDTLSGIALRHGTTVRAIASANGIKDARLIFPGQRLVLPGTAGAAPAPSPTPAPAPAPSAAGPSAGGTYTVRAGDTLSGIAVRHSTTVAAIARASGISSGSYIYPGQKLRLPGGTPAQAAPAPAPATPGTRSTPYDEHNIGDIKAGEKVPDRFLHYRYGDKVARAAAANREYLAAAPAPGRDEIKKLIVSTSKRHGVDPTLMLALSYQESGWNQRAVSPANAIGAMQVIPDSGRWASGLAGRQLNLLQAEDNVEAGVVIIKALLRSADTFDHAVGGYYQGLGSVRQYGLFADTKSYVANIKHHMRSL